MQVESEESGGEVERGSGEAKWRGSVERRKRRKRSEERAERAGE